MLVVCENCGAKYQINPDRIRGKSAIAKCKFCKSQILIKKSDQVADTYSADATPFETVSSGEDELSALIKESPAKPVAPQTVDTSDIPAVVKTRRKGLGLRIKMLLLFFLLPIILIAVASFFYINQLNTLSHLIRDESHVVVSDIAEVHISEKAVAVARQVDLFLKSHPDLKPEDLQYDEDFLKIAVQKVGETGFSVIDSGPTDTEPWINRAHKLKEHVGGDVLKSFAASLTPEQFQEFKKQHDDAARTQKMTTGYYMSREGRMKFQALAPVGNTNLWALATTYIDEFTLPIREMETKATIITDNTFKIVLAIVAGTILLVAIIVLIYSNRLSLNIRSLTDVANRISMGDMDVEVETKTNDEIGDLAEAVTRMQSSIRISIDRFRRRRRRR